MSFPLACNVRVAAAVENAVLSGKMPHAVIIEGEDGQGKHTLASYIAKAFLCKNKEKPCNCCDSCHFADSMSHPDIIYVSPKENKKFISVEQIRDLKQKVYIKPHIANGRAIIIESADRMNVNSQNALLKVLEEPPENTCFLLLTPKKESMLITVLSRCTVYSLTSPDMETGIEILVQKTGCDREKAEELLTEFHGNVGAAINSINKKDENTAYLVAKKFVSIIFDGNEYELLKLLEPYSKDRAFTESFMGELKTVAADEVKAINKNGQRARVLFSLYEDCDKYLEFLKYNAGLPLIMSALVAGINKQMR